MSIIPAVRALENENTSIDTLLDCLINLSTDRGYLLACITYGRRFDVDSEVLRMVILARVLRVRILLQAVEVKDARSIGYDRSVLKYLKRRTQQPQAVTRG
jgi:hypothetical protein